MKILAQKRAQLHADLLALDALLKQDDLTPEQIAQAESLNAQIKATEAEIDRLVTLEEAKNQIATRISLGATSRPEITPETTDAVDRDGGIALKGVDARLIHRARPQNFKGATREEAAAKAYSFGMFLLAAFANSPKAQKFCQDNGILLRSSHVESNNERGGYLVPDQFENDMIDLKEQYGVFRRNARVSTMTSDTKSRPRRTGGLTAYFVDEDTSGTESNATWDRVLLSAKKIMVLARVSSELNDDAVIDIGDKIAGEIAYAFAQKEDQCGFIGTGTSTYGGIVGVSQRLIDVFTTSGGTGLVLGAGNNWSELTLANFHSAVGALPVYADTNRVRWYTHKTFYHTVMQRLAMAAGGVTAAEIAAGTRTPTFMGYPVEFVQAMPSSEANSQVCAIIGDLYLAADFGDRRQTTVALSDSVYFTSDALALRGTERFDINVHDVGASGTAGPVVGVLTAAS